MHTRAISNLDMSGQGASGESIIGPSVELGEQLVTAGVLVG